MGVITVCVCFRWRFRFWGLEDETKSKSAAPTLLSAVTLLQQLARLLELLRGNVLNLL